MDKAEFIEKIQKAGTVEDETERREILAELAADANEVFEESSKMSEELKHFEEDNEKLRAANLKLFTQVGAEKTPEEKEKESGGLDKEEKPKRKIEDLFNEKGELK